MKLIRDHTELEIYQIAFDASMQIFNLSKSFPKNETYALTDQIRRSSRSVCANLAEAWRQRRYEGAFKRVLCICEAEAAETQVWLDFASQCSYIHPDKTEELKRTYDRVLGTIVNMIRFPDRWLLK